MSALVAVITLRFAVGAVAAIFMGLAIWGFRHVATPAAVLGDTGEPMSPSALLRASLTVYHVKMFARIAWWDVLVIAGIAVGAITMSVAIWASAANVGFNLVSICGSVLALKSQHRSIPEEDRAGYTILTAPFYPWSRGQRMSSVRRATETDSEASVARHSAANARTEMLILARHVVNGRTETAMHAARRIIDKEAEK